MPQFTPEQLAAEVKKRQGRRDLMRSTLLPQQRKALEDPARLKALLCTRRAGKSWVIGTYLLLTAMEFANSSCLYLGLTRETSRRIMNKDILDVLNTKFQIGAVWRESKSRWELPNGSMIYLQGADANQYELRKIVGQKYRLAVCDEASKYRQDLREMVYGALLPAMGDDAGTIVLSGTPSNVTSGLFFDVTTKAAPGWSTHSWSWRDNTYRLANIQQIHDAAVAANPAIVGTPLYRQEWLGQWVVDSSALVYSFREDRNTIDVLPKKKDEYTYVLGVDLGFSDPSAISVGAYHPNDPCLYIVYAQKWKGLTITDLATKIKALWLQPSLGFHGPYPFAHMIVDASALQAVEEMRQRHHLPLEAASKSGKRGVIEALNSDFLTGRVKLLPEAMAAAEEYNSLIWDERKLLLRKWEEDPRFANHILDSILYLWRSARNYNAEPEEERPPTVGSKEWLEERLRQELTYSQRVKEAGGFFVDELPDYLRQY